MRWFRKSSLGLLALGAFAAAGQAQVTVGNAVQVTPNGTGWAEITSAAFGPGEHKACAAGRLFFSNGYSVIATNLDGQAVLSLPQNPVHFQYNETVHPHVIYDNHMVKLKDGSLIHTVEAVTWNNLLDKPSWWAQTQTYTLKNQNIAGGRGTIYVRRSEDCGQTWTRTSEVDAALLEVPDPPSGPVKGLCGIPRLFRKTEVLPTSGNDPLKPPTFKEVRTAEAGGWDGHFLHADPYSGNLFLSTGCFHGTGNENEQRSRTLLLMSDDRGNNWKLIGQSTASMWRFRMPVASLPSGQVGMAYLDGNALKLAVFGPPYDNVKLEGETVATVNTSGEPPATRVNANIWGYASLSRDGAAGFRVSAFHWEPAGSGRKLTHRIFRRDLATSGPGQQIGATLTAGAPNGRDTLHGTFIDGPPEEDLAAFYWVERLTGFRVPAGQRPRPDELRVRFQLYRKGTPLLKTPGELTMQNGQPYTYQLNWNGETPFLGDYMTGASYLDGKGNRKIVAAWSEQGGLHMNTITVPAPPFLSAGVPKPLDLKVTPTKIPTQPTWVPQSIRHNAPKPAVAEVEEGKP